MMKPKDIVANGYEEIAEAYLARFGRSHIRTRKLEELAQNLPTASRVLDLGCGAGLPVAEYLTEKGFDVTGIDISARQIALAKRNVPRAHFRHGDMTAVEFPDASFDAIGAFYSIAHIPREEHAALLSQIFHWLKPGGRFVGSFGADAGDWQGPWLGTTMFFSHHSPPETTRLVEQAGLHIAQAETLKQDDEDASFFWVTAYKP